MAEPAYVRIAGQYARRIRTGQLPPGTQLPSHAEIARQANVSDIVVRKAVEMLQSQGLVRSVRRRGLFVADRPNLIRLAPERQLEGPEATFQNESHHSIEVLRDVEEVPAGAELANIFALPPDTAVTHTVTRATEDGRPISISDTFQPLDIADISTATHLEETIADRIPAPSHGEWLRTPSGHLVKTVHQQFIAANGRTIMVSDVSYPLDRYDAFVFRMSLK